MAEYDEDAVTDLISRIQVFCYPRRIRVKEFFNDFDPLRHGRCTIINFARALDTLGMQGLTDEEVDNLAEHFTEHGAHVAPPQVVNYVKFCEAIDRVTREQFIRRFPFKKEFPPEDVELLAKNYMTNKGDVHFMAMHNDISEVTSHEPPDFPRSDLVMKPDESEWSQSRYTVVDKLRSKVVEGRIRIKQYFQDFDPLRKGYCAASQVKTVLTILNLSKIVTREDYDQLIQSYAREDGMFCYGDFCADVNKAFATPNLEKDPLAQTSMPDSTSTMAARRNKVCLSAERLTQWEWLESKIRSKVQKHRVNLLPSFKDMDRSNCGHITKNQFFRVMQSMGFDLSEDDVGLLGNMYCDLGDHFVFNYVDFLKSVDVPSEDVELAIAQLNAPYKGEDISHYFNARGKVIPHESAILA